MTDPRIYSLAEAERTLPLVRRIVTDIQRTYRGWRDAVDRFELAQVDSVAGEPESAEAVHWRREAAVRAEDVARYIEELQALGVEFKDFRLGLVDFYALRDDRLVFLCWRVGESAISHWHELDAGFQGRQPIEPATFHEILP